MRKPKAERDIHAISVGFADLIEKNGGSDAFVARVRAAALGAEPPDYFRGDRIRTIIHAVAAVAVPAGVILFIVISEIVRS